MDDELRYKHFVAELSSFCKNKKLDGNTIINLIMGNMLFEDLLYFIEWDDKDIFSKRLLRELNE